VDAVDFYGGAPEAEAQATMRREAVVVWLRPKMQTEKAEQASEDARFVRAMGPERLQLPGELLVVRVRIGKSVVAGHFFAPHFG